MKRVSGSSQGRSTPCNVTASASYILSFTATIKFIGVTSRRAYDLGSAPTGTIGGLMVGQILAAGIVIELVSCEKTLYSLQWSAVCRQPATRSQQLPGLN